MAKLNRRNTIIVLAALVAATGAIAASGAFTTVEAQRTVNVNTAGDSGALLQLADNGSVLIDTETVGGNEILQINQTNLNQNALTRANFAIDVTNGGDNNVGFYVQTATNVGDGSLLDFRSGGSSIVGSANSVDINSGGSVSIDVVIDLRGDSNLATDIPENVTFVADTDEFGA